MRKGLGMAAIAWAMASCGVVDEEAGVAPAEDSTARGVTRTEAGGAAALLPGGAEECPMESLHPAGIDHWERQYPPSELPSAVTVCRGVDSSGQHVATVQIVNFEAGAKMRVLSEPAAGEVIGEHDTEFNKYPAWSWYVWAKAYVSTPPSSRLFSVTNSAPFMCNYPWPSCATPSATTSAMSFPQKKWNTITSLGDETDCYSMPDDPYGKRYGKRIFGLSDPRGSGRQLPYIRDYLQDCQSERDTVESMFAGLFDATVGHHPIYGDEAARDRRTFLGTRDTERRWGGTQDRAYVLTSVKDITIGDARNILVEDFRAMYTLQLDSGGSTQSFICEGGCFAWTRFSEHITSPDWYWGIRPVPEALAIYDAPLQ